MAVRHKWVTEKDTRPQGCRRQTCARCLQTRLEHVHESLVVKVGRSATYRKKKVWGYLVEETDPVQYRFPKKVPPCDA
jgi:hypothetical protein